MTTSDTFWAAVGEALAGQRSPAKDPPCVWCRSQLHASTDCSLDGPISFQVSRD